MKKELREKVLNKYDKKCAYCGEEIDIKSMQVDHIHPKANGGLNLIENYNPSCCNAIFIKALSQLKALGNKYKLYIKDL